MERIVTFFTIGNLLVKKSMREFAEVILGRGQIKFVVIAVDYFTKWVEAKPLAIITKKKIECFVGKNILSRFGIPRVLVSYNSRQFDTLVFRQFCFGYGISNHCSSP